MRTAVRYVVAFAALAALAHPHTAAAFDWTSILTNRTGPTTGP